MIRQISVFLENRAGQLAEITRTLAQQGVDIRAMNIAETSDYGLLRLIVDDFEKTLEVLNTAGYPAAVSEVVTIAVPDKPGGLAEALGVLDRQRINVTYMYSIFSRLAGKAYMVMKVNDPREAEKILVSGGVHVADSGELEIV